MDNEILSMDPETKIEILQGIEISQLDDFNLREVTSLLADPDKGVRNQLTMLLTMNPDDRIAPHIVEFVSSDEISIRNLAGEILVKLGDRAVDTLLDYLEKVDGNFDDEKFIIDVLGLIGNLKAEEKVLSVLNKTEDRNVKLSCLESLGNLKSENAVQVISKCYDEDELYKPTVIEALGKIGSKKAQDFMLEKYQSEDELTKFSIIESLGLIGNMDTFFFLLSELNTTSGPHTWVLLKSIKELKDKFNLDVPFDEKLKSAILKTIYEAQPEYKKAAIYLLGNFNDKEILSACITSFGEDNELDEVLRSKVLKNSKLAIQVFPKILETELNNPGRILTLVEDVLFNCDQAVTEILSGLNFRSFTDSLANYLTYADEEARSIAMNLLFKIDPKTAVLYSDKMLNDDNLWNKIRLIDNLGEIDDESVYPVLRRLAEDSEIMVSKRASDLLSQKTSTLN